MRRHLAAALAWLAGEDPALERRLARLSLLLFPAARAETVPEALERFRRQMVRVQLELVDAFTPALQRMARQVGELGRALERR